jgi:AcrR family transcriptional regulator
MLTEDWALRLERHRQQVSREEVVTSQRVRLIDAMAKAVAENGIASTSVSDVTARAGLPEEVFYAHFQDQESCFLAAYDLGVEVLATTVQDDIGSLARSPLARLERLLTNYFDVLAAEPEFARTFLIEIYAAGPRVMERRLEVMRRFSILLAETLGPEAEGGLDPLACEALVGAISSLVTTRVAAGEFDQLQDLRGPIMELARRLLSTDAAPPAGFEPATRGLEGRCSVH